MEAPVESCRECRLEMEAQAQAEAQRERLKQEQYKMGQDSPQSTPASVPASASAPPPKLSDHATTPPSTMRPRSASHSAPPSRRAAGTQVSSVSSPSSASGSASASISVSPACPCPPPTCAGAVHPTQANTRVPPASPFIFRPLPHHHATTPARKRTFSFGSPALPHSLSSLSGGSPSVQQNQHPPAPFHVSFSPFTHSQPHGQYLTIPGEHPSQMQAHTQLPPHTQPLPQPRRINFIPIDNDTATAKSTEHENKKEREPSLQEQQKELQRAAESTADAASSMGEHASSISTRTPVKAPIPIHPHPHPSFPLPTQAISATPPMMHVSFWPLTRGSSSHSAPPPLTSEEVLLEEESEDDASEIEATALAAERDRREWYSFRGVWRQILLLLQLAVRLVRTLGLSTGWMRMLFRLCAFAMVLMPAWILIGKTYFTAAYIKRSIRYGLNARNYLDMYLPHKAHPHHQTKQQQQQQTSTKKRQRSTSSDAQHATEPDRDGKGTTTSDREEHLCPRHASEVAHVQSRARVASVESSLSLVERLHLDALLNGLASAASSSTSTLHHLASASSSVVAVPTRAIESAIGSALDTTIGSDVGRGIERNVWREIKDSDRIRRKNKEKRNKKEKMEKQQLSEPQPSQSQWGQGPSSCPDNVADRTSQWASDLTGCAPNMSRASASPCLVSPQPLTPRTDSTSTLGTATPGSSILSSASPFVSLNSGGSLQGENGLAPVVIFLTGGAWSIGNKAWGALLGMGLSAHGVLVASVDYRNFPQGTVIDMLLDVNTAITWIFRHIGEYGGDPNNIFLVGQSAGAHLGSLAMLNNVRTLVHGGRTSWSASKLKGFIGISGTYNIHHIVRHFHKRGFPNWAMMRIMASRSDEELSKYSPASLVLDPHLGDKVRHHHLLPPVLLIHGTADKTVHWQATDYFARCLHRQGVDVTARFYKNYSHTDPIIEGPLTGHDHLCHDVMSFIRSHTMTDRMNTMNGLNHLNRPLHAPSHSHTHTHAMHRQRSGSSGVGRQSSHSSSNGHHGITHRDRSSHDPSSIEHHYHFSSHLFSHLLAVLLASPFRFLYYAFARSASFIRFIRRRCSRQGGRHFRRRSSSSSSRLLRRPSAWFIDDVEVDEAELEHAINDLSNSRHGGSASNGGDSSLYLALGRPQVDELLFDAIHQQEQGEGEEGGVIEVEMRNGQADGERGHMHPSMISHHSRNDSSCSNSNSNSSPSSNSTDAYIRRMSRENARPLHIDERSFPLKLAASIHRLALRHLPTCLTKHLGKWLPSPQPSPSPSPLPSPPSSPCPIPMNADAAAAAVAGSLPSKVNSRSSPVSVSVGRSYPLQPPPAPPISPPQPLIPRFLIRAARSVNPF